MITRKDGLKFFKNPEVIQAGVDAKRAAEDAAKMEGKSDEEAEVAGKNASLAARIAKIEELANTPAK